MKKRKTGLANCVEKQTILNGFCYATAVMTAITHLAFVQACAYFSTLKGNFPMIFFHFVIFFRLLRQLRWGTSSSMILLS